jgi:phage gp36-like protein
LDLVGFKAATIAAGEWVDETEARYPGWIANRLAIESQRIDARLRKRYACPFTAPYPLIVTEWLAQIVTEMMMRKRGIDATDEQAQTYVEDRKTAEAELLEAANAVDGLFDLPLRADTADPGIVAPQVLGYSEASPYVAFDIQAQQARIEDSTGTGTGDVEP